MKKQFLLFCILAEIISLNAQTIYYWRNDQNPPTDASWSSASPLYFWNGSAGAVPTGGEVIQFEGSNGLISTNDLVSTNRYKINFYNSTVTHTLNGSTTNIFYDNAGNHPMIQNWTGVLQNINFPFQIGNESALNYAYGMHIWAGNGGLNIGSTISAANATGTTKELVLTAGASSILTLSGIVSNGSGAIRLTKWGAGNLLISAANTYTGTTTINDGAVWIESGGSIANTSSITLGNAAATVSKFYLSSLTGGTTFAKAININAGNSGTRIIGGQNTSGTNTFSGNIVRSSSQPLTVDVPNVGGTVTVSGVISGSGDAKKTGYGSLNITGTNNSGSGITGNWLIEQGNINFAFFGTNLNGRPIILGNVSEIGTATYTGTGGLTQIVPISTNAGGGKFINIPTGDLKLTPGTQTQTIAGTFEIACNNTKYFDLAYILSGAGGVKVSSAGTGHLILSRANVYSGPTTINSGTLRLGAANAIPSGATGVQSAVTFNGGTLSTGASSAGFSSGTSTYPMGVLTIGASGGTITLAATTSTQNLYFANSSFATWGDGTLTINGWTGTTGETGTNGHIYIGAAVGTLTDVQLAKITFAGIAGSNGAMLLSSGELVPAAIPSITSFSASPNNETSTTGYIGSTITIIGANFTGATKVTVGSTDLSCSVINATTITFEATEATGTITVTTAIGGTSSSSSTSYANAGYITATAGNWNATSTWIGGTVPPTGAVVTIANNTTLNQDATVATLLINASTILTGSDGSSRTLTVANTGTFTNNGTYTATYFGTVTFVGSATINGANTFNNLTLNGTTSLNNAPTINGTITLNSGTTLVTNSPIYTTGSTLNYNLNNGFGAKYNQALEWPATSGPSSVLLTTNSWVQLTGDRSLTGNLTVTSGALQATGALRTLTMNGTTQTITVSTTTGGAIYGTDNGVGNDLQLTVANGSTTTFTGDATATDDDDKKFLNININSGGTLALARGILCKWGTFIVNGTLKINANGYIQSNNTSNSAAASTNKAADYSGGGSLVYNNGGSYTSSDKEWPTTNSPSNVTLQNAGTNVGINNAKTISGALTLTNGQVTLGANDLTIGAAGSISGSSATNFIVTDGIGKLVQSVTNSVAKTFPIGSSASSYDPAVINPTSSVIFAAKVGATLSGTPLNAGLTNVFEWDITPASGTPTATITLTPSVATNTSNSVIGYYSGSAWTESSASLSGISFSGTVSNFGKFATGSQYAYVLGIPTVTVTPIGTFTYNGSPQGPNAANVTGSTGTVTYSYTGTSYGPSATAPTEVGSYTVTATVAADGNFASASSSATAFSINDAPNTVNVSTLNPTIASLGLNTASDVTINNSGSLTVDVSKTVNSVTVDAGGKLVLSANTLTVKDLVIKSGKLDTESSSISLSNAMAISSGGSVKLQKTLDASKWYFISFPCNVAINSITQVSTTGAGTIGVIGSNWWIKYYDGEARVQNLGTSTNWVSMSAGETLTANKGYIIGLDNALTADHVLSFTLENTLVTTAESAITDKTVDVVAYGEGFQDNKNTLGNIVGENHKGWNLVGSPYLSKYDGSGVEANFLTFHNGTAYQQKDKTAVGRFINPFEAFFVQASSAGTGISLTFTQGSRQLAKSTVGVDLSDRVQLIFTSATGVDNTNLIMDNTQSTDYQINQDLEKWITTGTNAPQVYTVLGGINYAYNALPMSFVNHLPVGIYTKTAGFTTINVDATKAPSLSKLLLTDNGVSPATVTDLLVSNYTFTAAAGTNNSRFAITAQRITTDNNVEGTEIGEMQMIIIPKGIGAKLIINNLAGNEIVRVFDALGRMVLSKTANSNSLEIKLNTKGIYTVQLQSGTTISTRKVIF